MDPWGWFRVSRGMRVSYAIGLLCLCEVRLDDQLPLRIAPSGSLSARLSLTLPPAPQVLMWTNSNAVALHRGSEPGISMEVATLHATVARSVENLKVRRG